MIKIARIGSIAPAIVLGLVAVILLSSNLSVKAISQIELSVDSTWRNILIALQTDPRLPEGTGLTVFAVIATTAPKPDTNNNTANVVMPGWTGHQMQLRPVTTVVTVPRGCAIPHHPRPNRFGGTSACSARRAS